MRGGDRVGEQRDGDRGECTSKRAGRRRAAAVAADLSRASRFASARGRHTARALANGRRARSS
ncbi:hypothetical protein DR62_07985 [Burkholderia thailandensis]|nr:hypothetical protein DR62_07985 [Burkholderia thailandensis]AOI55805.1 hypothetical protein WI24_29365 [Burkholderia thailandensis]AOJ54772.1 hypothetical protein AQ475_29160 [Burkholderia thailandensis]AOJ60711.1 hypothetical protein AQ477_30440 [Burkholderia thailandensis]KXF57700.1 hypothetical protein AQ476_23340 [Burkholderia thailandensis]